MNYSVVIPAAGNGSRMQLGYNKLFFEWQGKSILAHTTELFMKDHRCKQIIIVHAEGEQEEMKAHLIGEKYLFVVGGRTRTESVYAGLQKVDQRIVLIHDGARPFLSFDRVEDLLSSLHEYQASILAVPCKDTIKIVKNSKIEETPERSTLWQAQTPQGFHIELILDAYQKAMETKVSITDDASAVELFSDQKVSIVMGSYRNIKVTTMEDLPDVKQSC